MHYMRENDECKSFELPTAQLVYQYWQHCACCDDIPALIDELDDNKLLPSSLCQENQKQRISAYYCYILRSLS
jgi:hypothetical protein